MATPADLPTDGRVQRSERSRESIVQAMLDLIGAGVLTPTAQQVAERADVGVRTVFRHFNDMETLFATLHDRLTDEVEHLFVDEVQSGAFEERLDGLIENRFTIYDRLAHYLRASVLQRSRSEFVRAQHDRNIRRFRADLRRWLPEIEHADPEVSDAVDLLLSFEAYDRLRNDQRSSARRARQTIRNAVAAVAAPLA